MVFDIKKTCRACMAETTLLTPIWDMETESSDEDKCSSMSWKAEILNAFTKSGVAITDQRPQHICVMCEKILEQAYLMKQKCEKSESEFERYQSSMAVVVEHEQYDVNYDDYENNESQITQNYDDDDGEWVEIKMHDDIDAKGNSGNFDQQNPSTSHSYSVQQQGPSFALTEQNQNGDDENENGAFFDENPYDDANLVEYESGIGNDENQKENKRPKLSLSDGKGRLHICQECGKGFTQKCSLTRHKKNHTGERPHVCQICQKRFTRSDLLTQHMKTHAAKQGTSNSDPN